VDVEHLHSSDFDSNETVSVTILVKDRLLRRGAELAAAK
jgi:hypothetical protein